MGSCLTCFRTPPNANTSNAMTSGVLRGPERMHNLEAIAHETDDLLTAAPLHATDSCIYKSPTGMLNGNVCPVANESTNNNATCDIIGQISDNDLNQLFEKYKDKEEDAILSDGIERLCQDLGYQPDDFAILVLAWRLNASQMCQFTRAEFIQGLQHMNAASIDEIRLRLNQIIDRLRTDANEFKLLYRFTFRFGLEQGHRSLSLEMAMILWRLVFTVHTPDILQRWLDFLGQHQNIRGVPKDTWNMFLNFVETCDITQYDDTEAWPSLFDDFVEHEQERMQQKAKEGTGAHPPDDDNNNDYGS